MATRALPELATEDGMNPTGRSSQAAKPSDAARRKAREAASPIVNELSERAATAVQKRSATEERWMKDLRQFHGIYDASIVNVLTGDDSRSKIFLNITRPKTNAWAARLGDMLFPNDERNWGIEPTPVPELTQGARDMIAEAEALDEQAKDAVEDHNMALEAGETPPPELQQAASQAGAAAQEIRARYTQTQKEMEEARKRARAMEREIDDQFTEANYPRACRRAIEDAAKLGTGIIKGPFLGNKSPMRWQMPGSPANDTEGSEPQASSFSLQSTKDDAPMWRRVDPWHFFPDPDAETTEDAEWMMERHIPNRKTLRRMAKQLGFDKDVVRKMLEDGPQQDKSSDLKHLANLRTLENGGSGTTDATNSLNDRFVVWEFYGVLEPEHIAAMIRATGRMEDADRYEEETDTLDVKMVRLFFADRQLLKIEEDYLLDRGDFSYSVFPFERSESSIMGGVGVPHLMHDEQSMLNSAVRMMMDNAGLAVGPQTVIDKTQIEPEDGNWRITPRKVWQWIQNTAGRKEAPFTTFDIPMNQPMLAAIVDMALKFTDEAVSMPLIAQGEQGSHITKTASGMSMLFNSANVVFRRVVKNWDDFITAPCVQRAYDFNMQFSDKEEIKGDMNIEARGTSVLLVREIQAEQLLSMIDRYATHPILGVAMKAYEAMKLVLQAMNINPSDVLLDREEYMEKLAAMSEDEGTDPDTIRAQTAIEVAQIDAQSRLATSESNERVAQLRMNTEFAQLAQEKDIDLAKIEAMFAKAQVDASTKVAVKDMETKSGERKLATEIAVEERNAREARAAGDVPTGSGGAISLGVDER